MRPVEKFPVGATVVVQGTPNTVQSHYEPYQDAKPVLLQNLGSYCSYCESYEGLVRDIQVEHVQPKGLPQYSVLATDWTNFLLSCSTCNGADNKDTKNVVLSDVHLPHRNNTFLSLKYLAGGVVIVNPILTGISAHHAENLLKLVGFDKAPSACSSTDNRWKRRMEAWSLAAKYCGKYTRHEVDVETIIDLAMKLGFWSTWFTIFHGHDEVRKALIERFPGTAASCFDPNNHYEPVERNKDQVDPV